MIDLIDEDGNLSMVHTMGKDENVRANFNDRMNYVPVLIESKYAIPGPEVIKLFSSSAQLSMKSQLLINVEIIKISGKFRFKTQKLAIYPTHKY